MSYLRIVYKFFKHFLTARHTGGFGVHSPFMFKFINIVLAEKHPFYVFNKIEKVRESLKLNKRILDVVDFGTGDNRRRTVSDIAFNSLKSKRHAQLLYRIIRYCGAKNVLELGTSLGVTTAYLASVNESIRCYSMEGSADIATVAAENFRSLGINNITLIVGNIDESLPEFLSHSEALDFVFVDANHRSEAVLNYVNLIIPQLHNASVLVVDDIYWSVDMEFAWSQIKNLSQVTSTIDLFHFGIVFFNVDLNKKHYKVRY